MILHFRLVQYPGNVLKDYPWCIMWISLSPSSPSSFCGCSRLPCKATDLGFIAILTPSLSANLSCGLRHCSCFFWVIESSQRFLRILLDPINEFDCFFCSCLHMYNPFYPFGLLHCRPTFVGNHRSRHGIATSHVSPWTWFSLLETRTTTWNTCDLSSAHRQTSHLGVWERDWRRKRYIVSADMYYIVYANVFRCFVMMYCYEMQWNACCHGLTRNKLVQFQLMNARVFEASFRCLHRQKHVFYIYM